MALTLPAGVLPVILDATEGDVLVRGRRETEWRFDLLTRGEVYVGELQGVQSGSVDWSASASIKGGGSITVADTGQAIDWLNVRIRPVARIRGIDRDIPVGVWLVAAPVEKWTDEGRTWEVELLDKASVLDADVWDDPESETVGTFSAAAGATVTQVVRDLITGAGESAAAVEDDPTNLSSAMVWEAGTTRLRIINDLLDAAGFFSLWVDMAGQFQVTKYTPPSSRSPMYEAVAPFESGPTSIMSPDFTVDRDVYAIPNRYVAISAGDGETEAMVAEARNTDPDSPFSYEARGRWIVTVDTDVEAVDQQALETYAARRLAAASAVAAKVPIQHAFLPDLTVNSVVRLVNDRAELNLLAVVTSTSVDFNPVALCSTDLQEVTS